MEQERLAEMIEGGVPLDRIVAAKRNPVLQATNGWNLASWEYLEEAGMILFRRLTAPGPEDERIETLANLANQKREAEAEVDRLRARAYHEAEARRASDAAQKRANRLAAEMTKLRRELREEDAGEPEVEAAILCVNAPESERSTYEAEATSAARGRYPVVVLMRGQWTAG